MGPLTRTNRFLNYFSELIIVVLILLIFKIFLGFSSKSINSDGAGYYDYLPSIFIYHDLVRKDAILSDSIYLRIDKQTQAYVIYSDKKVNKYSCGTAFFQLPQFLINLYFNKSDTKVTGLEPKFQQGSIYTSLVFLFLSLILIKNIFKTYSIPIGIIFFCQLLISLATPALFFVNSDTTYSHIYSLFAISGFILMTRKYFDTFKNVHFFLAAFFLGLIFITRNVNLLVILSIPFLAGNRIKLTAGFNRILNNYTTLFTGVIIFFAICSIQMLVWYLQTGHWILYSYTNESFDFLDPNFFTVLFGYKKGLYTYTPILFLTTLSTAIWIWKKDYYKFISWIVFFTIVNYVISSWWAWSYGASFGLRVYVDFLPYFFIPFAVLLANISKIYRILFVALALITIPINVIMIYQYKNYILKWNFMNKEDYWKVFLITNTDFTGYLSKPILDIKNYELLYDTLVRNVNIDKEKMNLIFRINFGLNKAYTNTDMIRLEIENTFEISNSGRIILCIERKEDGKCIFWRNPPLIQFSTDDFGQNQLGYYNWILDSNTTKNGMSLDIIGFGLNEKTTFKKAHLKLYRLKTKLEFQQR